MIHLRAGDAAATIDPNGAWLTELNAGETAVLYPKTELMSDSGTRLTRGGMHVCLPNFGPSTSSALPQHGFGRTLPWEVMAHDQTSLELQLQGMAPQYSHLLATLRYTLESTALRAELNLVNNGALSLRVAPGFHPYFMLHDSETAISLNNQVYELASLAETLFVTTPSIQFHSLEQNLELTEHELSTWALWTDSLGPYVCVEPTYGGRRFLQPPADDEHLAPGSERAFAYKIRWA